MADEDFNPTEDDITPLTMDDIANHLSQQADEMIRNGADPKTVGAAMRERMDKIQTVYQEHGPKVFGPKSNFYNKPDVAGLEGIYSDPQEPGIYGQGASLNDVGLVEGSNTKNVLTYHPTGGWSADADNPIKPAPGLAAKTADAALTALTTYLPHTAAIPPLIGGVAGGLAAGQNVAEFAIDKALGGDTVKYDPLDAFANTARETTEGLTYQPQTEAGEAIQKPVDWWNKNIAKPLGEKAEKISPELGALADTGANLFPWLVAGGGLRGIKNAKEAAIARSVMTDMGGNKGWFGGEKVPEVDIPKTGEPEIDTGLKAGSKIYNFDNPEQLNLFGEREPEIKDMFSGEVKGADIAERDRDIAKQASIFGDEQRLPSEDEANVEAYKDAPIVPGMPLTRRYTLGEPKAPVEETPPQQAQLGLGQGDLFSQEAPPPSPVVTRGDLFPQDNQTAPTPAPIVTRGDLANRAAANQQNILGIQSKVPEAPQATPDVTLGQVSGTRGLFSPAYHGSPHEFDQFSTDAIGTGEGAQVYGHGLYFAGSKDVANYYKQKFGQKALLDGKTSGEYPEGSPDRAAAELIDKHGSYTVARERINSDIKFYNDAAQEIHNKIQLTPKDKIDLESIQALQDKNFKIQQVLNDLGRPGGRSLTTRFDGGKGYSVELAPEEHEYLDWDKPLSQQSQHVKDAVQKLDNETVGAASRGDPNISGEDIYRNITQWHQGNKARASSVLHDAGIRGVRYLDGASRNVGKGSSNYVIFNDKDVKITGRFSSPDMAGGEGLSRTVWNALDNGELTGQHVLDSVADNHDNIYGKNSTDNEARVFTNAMRQRAQQMGRGLDTPIELLDPSKHADSLARLQEDLKAQGKDPNDWGAYFDPVDNRILVNGERNMRPSTLVHEVTHAVTHQAIQLGIEGKLTGPALKAYNNLNSLFEHIRDNSPELAKKYGFTDLHEMMAEMYGSDAFREALKNYKLDTLAQAKIGMPRTIVGVVRNAYQAMMKGVKDLLGMGLNPKAENALDALFSQSKDFLDKFDKRDAEPSRVKKNSNVDNTFNGRRDQQLTDQALSNLAKDTSWWTTDPFGEHEPTSPQDFVTRRRTQIARDRIQKDSEERDNKIVDIIKKSTRGEATRGDLDFVSRNGGSDDWLLVRDLQNIHHNATEIEQARANRLHDALGVDKISFRDWAQGLHDISNRIALRNDRYNPFGEESPPKGHFAPNANQASIYEASLSPRRAIQNLRETQRGEEGIPGKLGLIARNAINDAAKSEKAPQTNVSDYVEGRNPKALDNYPNTKAAVDKYQADVRTPLANQEARERLLAGDQKGANEAFARGQGELVSAYEGPKFAKKMFQLAEAGDKLQANGGNLQPEHIDAMQKRDALHNYVKAKFYPNGFTPTPEGLKAVDQYAKELTGLRDSIFGLRTDLSGKNSNFVRAILANGGLGRGFAIPKEVADALGKTNDAAANVLNTSLKQGLNIARTRFQENVLKAGLEGNWLWKTKEEAPAGSVALTGSHWGNLEGVHMSPWTKRQFMNVKELSVSTEDLMNAMLKSNGALSIAKGTLMAGLEGWMGAVTNLKGLRILTAPKNYVMFAMGSFSRLLSGGFNFGVPTAIRGMRESINEFRSGITGADHMELQRNGLIDYAAQATQARKIKAAQFSNDLEMNPIREAMQHVYSGSGDAAKNFAAKMEGTLSAMDYWSIKANYFKRKEQLQAYYNRQGIDKDPREIEREAADQTKQTNLTPSRNFSPVRGFEKMGASISIPYVIESHRNIANSFRLGGQDVARAIKTNDIAFGLVGVKRLIGTALAITAMDYVYKQLGQAAASALGVTSTPVPEDDKRQAQLQDEGSRFSAGKASQLTDASTEADKQNAIYWDPGGAWDPFYSVSQEIARTTELVANWNNPNFDKEKQLGRIMDNFTAIVGHNPVSAAAVRFYKGSAPPLARRDEDTYNAESGALQNGTAGLSQENANRLLTVQDAFTPQAVKDWQNTKGLSTGMQILGQLGYSVTKVPKDGGLSSFEATKFSNTAEKARTAVTGMLQDNINYSDATIERRYINSLKTMNDALEKVRNAADFGRGSGVDESDMQRSMLDKNVNEKVIGTLGDAPPAEILYRNITGGIEKRGDLLDSTDQDKSEAYLELASKKMDKFVELTEKYMEYTPQQIKDL